MPDELGAAVVRWDDVPTTDLVIVAVSDDALPEVAAQASAAVPMPAVLLHVSGIHDSSLFGDRGGTGSLHPLASLPAAPAIPDLTGTAFVFEGDERAQRLAAHLAGAAGASLHEITRDAKPLYHTAAVFSSNYVATLLELAHELFAQSGAAIDRPTVAALAATAIRNWEAKGTGGITGPLVRGDAGSIEAHIRALSPNPEALGMYLDLADSLLARHSAADPRYQRIAQVLDRARIR